MKLEEVTNSVMKELKVFFTEDNIFKSWEEELRRGQYNPVICIGLGKNGAHMLTDKITSKEQLKALLMSAIDAIDFNPPGE